MTVWLLHHPVHGLRLNMYPSEAAAMRALGYRWDEKIEAYTDDPSHAEVERQRRDGWEVKRYELVPSPCSLCGEEWTVGHECIREGGSHG